VFYTATLRFIEDKDNIAQEHSRSNLPLTEWLRALVKGAGDDSPRWRHTLLLGALLLAFQSREFDSLSSNFRGKLEAGLVTAANLALNQKEVGPNSEIAVVFVLNHTFPILSDSHRAQLDHNLLLPAAVDAALFSHEGLEHGYFVGVINDDIKPLTSQRLNWSASSQSFRKVSEIRSRSLISALGALSRLIAYAIENVQDRATVIYTANRLAEFSRNLSTSWKRNSLSQIEPREEAHRLDQETTTKSLPLLLQLLRDTTFATIIILRSVLGRVLCDGMLASNNNAPMLAVQSLHVLRDTYFVAHRFGLLSSSQYMFVNFTAIDILSRYTTQCENFLETIRPTEFGKIPAHPLDRLFDLFFLNTAEHFTLVLPPRVNQELLFNAAAPYVDTHGDPRLGEIFEAAHSVMLAILAAPQNTEVAAKNIPFYVETLSQSFPKPLTARQFRLAIKSIVRLAAPPSSIANFMPLMQAIILDLLRERMEQASEEILQPNPDVPLESNEALSEKAVLLLCIIDCLSFLPVPLLEEWLPMTADLLHTIADPRQKQQCRQRLWATLSNGEMDLDRAAGVVAWWTSRGGREHVLLGQQPDEQIYTMSGALPMDSKL
jgi:hypothetical protein